jgi:hypothetical protein
MFVQLAAAAFDACVLMDAGRSRYISVYVYT